MDSNRELVNYLVERGFIESEGVENAFRSVDRADFVSDSYREDSYRDMPIKIGEGATISAPHMVAINTELLEPEEGDNVLEIGSGSGYQLAVLSEIVEEAVGVEIDEKIVEKSRKNLEGRNNVRVVHGNGLEHLEEIFDKIIYSCAVQNVDEAFEYLRGGGLILAPVQEDQGQVLKKFEGGNVEEYGKVRFVEKKG